MAKVQFLRGLQADYDALEKDSYVFYYCLDTEKFYLGSIQLNSEDLSSFLDILNNIENQVEDLTTKVNNTIQEIEISGGTEDGTIALWVNGDLVTNNIHVTGLGSAAYTDTYNYATAEQGALAEEAMPRSGGSFIGDVYLYRDPSNALEAATKQYVDNQISTGISANDAMVFKGTLGTDGTIETVPTGSDVRTGDTYKIITNGEWAGYDCTVGDLLIALVNGPMEEANSNTWAYIPSGNEEVTTLRYSNTETNITSWAQSGDMILAEGAIKQVDSFIDNETGSTNLPTSAAVAAYVQQEINNAQSDSSTVTTDSPSQGSPTNPVYLDDGKVTPIFGTVGSYNQPVFLNNGNIVACEETFEDLKNDIQKEVPSVTVGTTETGEPGTDAYVYNASTDNNVVLNFIVPRGDQGEKGDKGDTGEQGPQGAKGDTGDTGATGATGAAGADGKDGDAATIVVGTVTTGDAGTSASVTNSGTSSAAVFDFVIPKGDKGDSTTTTYTGGTGISISGTTINHSNSISAGTAQGASSKTLTFGDTFTMPTITYDAQGHVTSTGTTTMTMPANPLGSSTVGSTSRPIYLNSGTPTALTATVGSGTKPIYLDSGTLTASTSTVGSTTQPVYLNSGTITAMSGALATTYGGTGNTSGRATYVNITSTNPDSGTTYYLPFTTGISSGTNYSLNGNNGIRYNTLEGTTDSAGYGRLYLGNSTASGTAGNKYGAVMIYGNTGYYWLITGNSSYPAANRTLYMPRSTANGYLVATGAGTGTAVGSATTPVYISSGGIATACSSSIPTFSVSGSTLIITT